AAKAQHWNGTAWTDSPMPNLGTRYNYLADVAMVSHNDVWAVGQSGDNDNHEYAVILHWDGAAWNFVPSPNPGIYNYLTGISAVSANDIWAVASTFTSTADRGVLVLHWDGTAWTRANAPNPPQFINYAFLRSVVALSANNVWAAGDFVHPDTTVRTL